VRAGDLLFTSGQLPARPSGELVADDIHAATRQCLENVRRVLEAGGASLEDVVKVTVFLTDMADFAAMNEAYSALFSGVPPARTCVQVAALPKGARIEIEAIAAL
jgi:2-iminobutanoate/2-iminopropanoate deaminase